MIVPGCSITVVFFQQYDGTVFKVAPAAKNAASKNHPKDILHDKNHLYRVVLVHLTSNVAFKTRKHFQMAGY